jgi:hypothetical protein
LLAQEAEGKKEASKKLDEANNLLDDQSLNRRMLVETQSKGGN